MSLCRCAECESHPRDHYTVERWCDGEQRGEVFETGDLGEALKQAEVHAGKFGRSTFRVWDNEMEAYRHSEEEDDGA